MACKCAGVGVGLQAASCSFGMSTIEPLCSPGCHKRPLLEASRGFSAGSIPSVMKF